MITIYDQFETDFTHNGLGVLKPTQAVIEEELNGVYKLELTHPIDSRGKWKLLAEENIIKANGQLFRIKKPKKDLSTITVYAEHIFYDLNDNFIEDTNIVNKSGTVAIQQIMDKLLFDTSFTASSNISTVSSARIVRKNAISALFGSEDNTFINRWGGELYRDNFFFSIDKKIGKNRGVRITHTKNLTGLDVTYNTLDVYTVIMPIGYDGLQLPEKYVYSPLVSKYKNPKVKEVKFESVKVKVDENEEGFDTKEEAYEELRRLSKLLFEEQHVDIPSVSYKIDFILLMNTTKYKDLKKLEVIKLGDEINIYHPKLDIDITARCIRYRYDCLSKKYLSMELGNFQKNFIDSTNSTTNDIFNKIDENEKNFSSELEKAKDNATNLITNAMGGYVYKTNAELFIMDSDDPSTAEKVWRWNINGLGYSRNGINGPYEVAMTMDGKIVADFITVGVLNAALIKAGVLQSENGLSWIDMENGTFSFANGALTYSIENGFEINGYATTNDLNQYPTKTDLSTSGKTVINGGNITTGFLSADRISGGFLTSKNNDLRFNLDEGRLGIYSNNTLLATALKMKENKSGKYGMGILANNSSFISLGLGDNDDNTVYKPYIALANRITGTEWDSGINLLTTVHGWFNHLKNFKLVWDGFKRSNNDSIVLYSTNQNSTDSKLIMELANDHKTSFEIVSKMYNSGEQKVASFRGTGGSEYNPEESAGINFYQNLDMHGYRIWGAQTLNAMSLEVESDDAYVKAQSHISFATVEGFNVAKTQYISTSTKKSVNHIGSIVVENKTEYVELPNDFLMCVNINVVATPNKLCKFAVTHVDEYGFIIECDETEVKFDYSVTAHKI